MLYAGDMETGETVTQAIRAIGDPIADVVSPHPFTGFQAAFDPLLMPGARNYWKSHNFAELSDEAIDVVLEYAGNLPTGLSEIFLAQMGRATARVAQAYGANYDRLKALKSKYDPDNVFRLNQNIAPA